MRAAVAIRLGVVTLVILLAVPDANAQLVRPDPEARDFDQDAEESSKLWERTLHPRRDEYDNLVTNANRRLRYRDSQNRQAAEALLLDAIILEPDEPLAYWYLGTLYADTERWQKCVDTRQRNFDIAPDYRPPANLGAAWSLDFSLGQCLGHAGHYEKAIEHYKRILTTKQAPGAFQVHWRLGEALMALGRLNEAISALKTAAKLSRQREPLIHYALATAYDRDEQLARSRDDLQVALSRDPRLQNLSRSNLHFTPPADEWYYRGLAEKGRYLPRPEWALVYFRRFLTEHGDGPWARRAAHHIEDLHKEPLTLTRIVLTGVASIDLMTTAAAIDAADIELQRCLAPIPNVLLGVRITVIVKRKSRARRQPRIPSRVEPGVRTTIDYSFAAKAETIASAIQCVDTVAQTIDLPLPKGVIGEYVQVYFPLIAR